MSGRGVLSACGCPDLCHTGVRWCLGCAADPNIVHLALTNVNCCRACQCAGCWRFAPPRQQPRSGRSRCRGCAPQSSSQQSWHSPRQRLQQVPQRPRQSQQRRSSRQPSAGRQRVRSRVRLATSGPRRASLSGWPAGLLAVAHRRCRLWWQLLAMLALQQVLVSSWCQYVCCGTLCLWAWWKACGLSWHKVMGCHFCRRSAAARGANSSSGCGSQPPQQQSGSCCLCQRSAAPVRGRQASPHACCCQNANRCRSSRNVCSPPWGAACQLRSAGVSNQQRHWGCSPSSWITAEERAGRTVQQPFPDCSRLAARLGTAEVSSAEAAAAGLAAADTQAAAGLHQQRRPELAQNRRRPPAVGAQVLLS